MWWIILTAFGLIFIILIYLLFARLFIEIDSNANIYKFGVAGLVSGEIILKYDSIWIRFIILGYRKEFDLIKPTKSISRIRVEKPLKQENTKPASIPNSFNRIVKVFVSFKVKKCVVSIDTGSMPLNGILYPWFYMLSVKINKKIMNNFWGENTLILRLENTLARMLWAYFKS